MKNAWLAGLLNLFPGLGYLYIGGNRLVFGIMLILFWPVAIIGSIIQVAFQPNLLSNTTSTDTASTAAMAPIPVGVVLAFILFWISFAVDAYIEAQRLNQRPIK